MLTDHAVRIAQLTSQRLQQGSTIALLNRASRNLVHLTRLDRCVLYYLSCILPV
jgi:hypothetical protein